MAEIKAVLLRLEKEDYLKLRVKLLGQGKSVNKWFIEKVKKFI